MAELEKLLAFMSSWDRQAVLAEYEKRFDETRDPYALIEELGTPTKVAVELARDYVSSPPPPGAFPEQGAAPLEPLAAQEPAEPPERPAPARREEPPEEGAAPETEGKPRPGTPARLLFWLFAIVIGLPVAALLICLGVPFLTAGIGTVAAAVNSIPGAIGGFRLLSDVLLVAGSGLALLAVGLLLAWFGLWISISLCRLWIERVILSLGKRVYPDA